MSRCTEEPTKSYMKVVLTPEMGQGIMPNTVRKLGNFIFEIEWESWFLHRLTPVVGIEVLKLC